MKVLVLAVLSLSLAAQSPAKKQKGSDLSQYHGTNDASSGSFYAHNETSCPKQECAHNEPPVWWKHPEWWLFIVAVPTLIFVGWQAKATADAAQAALESANATEKSVKLQEATFKQWVTVEHWRNSVRGGGAEEIKQIIGFSVCNPTRYPLTLTKVHVDMGSRGSLEDAPNYVIAPEKDYESSFPLTLKGEADLRMHKHIGVIFTVTITVGFIDVLTEPRFS
jgi:hypothetical protein